jgi:hypothetical protein
VRPFICWCQRHRQRQNPLIISVDNLHRGLLSGNRFWIIAKTLGRGLEIRRFGKCAMKSISGRSEGRTDSDLLDQWQVLKNLPEIRPLAQFCVHDVCLSRTVQ